MLQIIDILFDEKYCNTQHIYYHITRKPFQFSLFYAVI